MDRVDHSSFMGSSSTSDSNSKKHKTKNSNSSMHEPLTTKKKSVIPKVLGIGFFVIMIGFWAWIFSGQPTKYTPGLLKDDTYGELANPICTIAIESIDLLPKAPFTTTPETRAEVIELANDTLVDMVTRLTEISPTNENDQQMVSEWIADWNVYIQDRQKYASALRQDPEARFLVTEKEKTQITKSLDRFAEFNKMPACQTPQDV